MSESIIRFSTIALLLLLSTSHAFQSRSSYGISSVLSTATSLSPDSAYPTSAATPMTRTSQVELRTYTHDGWTLKYRYKPAARGKENEPALLLIHPVGIGMSSWFWEPFLATWNGGAVYAPDLLGCGIDNGSDAWHPEQRNLGFPTSWVEGCETLLQKIVVPNNNSPLLSSLWGGKRKDVTVVTQGGLAPVGVLLASRNPNMISRLVMTSPPTWKDMTTAVPKTELDNNYNFLTSSLGKLAFGALESSWAIRFFSNLFLFQGSADPQWMSQCLQECRHAEAARPPIQAFNAGLMQERSYRNQLKTLTQPTLIVQGKSDTNRIPLRLDYRGEMKDCTLVTLSQGLNVLPWECPTLFAETLQKGLEVTQE